MVEHKCVNEERFRHLEQQEAVMGVKIENLINTMNTLLDWIKLLVVATIPVGLSGLGVLLWEVIKK